jgi:hypothetical protein
VIDVVRSEARCMTGDQVVAAWDDVNERLERAILDGASIHGAS